VIRQQHEIRVERPFRFAAGLLQQIEIANRIGDVEPEFAVLARAEKFAGTAQFQIRFRDLETVGRAHHRFETHARIDHTIFEEFSRGVFSEETRRFYLELIGGLDVDAVAFACTEIGLLLDASDVAVPVYDTARTHAEALVDYALNSV